MLNATMECIARRLIVHGDRIASLYNLLTSSELGCVPYSELLVFVAVNCKKEI